MNIEHDHTDEIDHDVAHDEPAKIEACHCVTNPHSCAGIYCSCGCHR